MTPGGGEGKGLGLLEGIDEEVDQYGHGGSGGKGYQPGQEDVRRHLEVESFAGVFPTVDPATAEERTWVVETGAPTRLPTRMIRAAESWEEKPWTGVIPTWLIFSPTVRMIRQPPIVVPSPMAAAAVTTTQKGTPADLEWPNSAMRTSVITPIVFCPSLDPCENETAAPEKIVIHLRSLGWTTGFLPAALGPASGSVARVTTQARRTPEGEYDLGQGAPLDAGEPVSRQSCSHQASDEGMGTRYGEPVEPGPKVPHEPGDQGCEYVRASW